MSQEPLDLRGVPCPQNVSRLLLKLGGLDQGTVLEVLLDSGEPYDNVMESLSVEGIEVVEMSEKKSGFKKLRVIAK
ncbi:MAG: sulfurtransferase TusA family protein [Proteobacteria bacterium]|nr:sulfurtransferase TusA family protein [Pseudomonadota bacterium]NDC22940.1 sulfurtransferase TusA family protein [Pseudomonadota bacterium]NDD04705.1 sulfurtransferase TusA family protein [Pseudomonadota bacterium]NDG27759.1 sulfurtransferase TusA family protein [Pseudomonadota bacterium]